jgi:histidyl-tRNA synthetase
MKLRKPQGTEDVLPGQIPIWRYIEDAVRDVFSRYGYSEIRTPIMEFHSLFNRSAGETSDVAEKQMYLLKSRDEDESDGLALRPELTASVVRAYLEHSLDKTRAFQKLYYFGPFFRHERPQKGRLRQFHQIGVEALGSYEPLLDVEAIDLATTFFRSIGLKDCQLHLNSMGCPDCRRTYAQALQKQLEPDTAKLCENCRRRFSKNILRILDCKEQKCYGITSRIAPMEGYLCPSCRTHFELVKQGLDDNRIVYTLNSHLVRGFDYYTRTVFEITYPGLGAQNTLCGGGRYDNLVEQFGGPKTGAVGFAMGVERIIGALGSDLQPSGPGVYLVFTGDELKKEAFKIIRDLRRNSVSADMDYEGKSLKAQFRNADRLKAKFVAVIGPDEIAKGAAKIKEMATGAEKEIKLNAFVEEIRGALSGNSIAAPTAPEEKGSL